MRVTQIFVRCVGLVMLVSACQNDRPISATSTTTSIQVQRLPESLAQLRLAFVLGGDDSDIYSARADGSELTRLTNERRLFEYDPDWSPDRSRIAYRVELIGDDPMMDVEPGASYIFVMNAVGFDPTNLSALVDAPGSGPSWAPDGRRLAFAGMRPDDVKLGIYIVDVDQALAGAGQEALTRLTPGEWEAQYPAWAPDGNHIAFTSLRHGNPNLYLMDAGGSGLTQLTDHQTSDNWPTWSPDSREIAFYSERIGGDGIYKMSVDGSGLSTLNPFGGEPAWSRNGEWIAFDCPLPENEGIGICAVRPDGSGFTHLLGGLDAGFPAWTP